MKWSNLSTLGKWNFAFFAGNMFFMCTTVMFGQFGMSMIHCICAFACWVAMHAPNARKDDE